MKLHQPNDLNSSLSSALAAARHKKYSRPQVFVSYVLEDRAAAVRLCSGLEQSGFDPWMDCTRLQPGENWRRSIDSAIANARFFVACLSPNSVNKRSYFQAELRYALECDRNTPSSQIYFVPVRFDKCEVPPGLTHIQYVNLFPDWERGFGDVVAMMNRQLRD